MKAVILAGGKGTRLSSFTKEIPKPMIKVGNKSVLEHQILLLKKYGFSEVIILVNYLKKSIIDYFSDGTKFGLKISYFEEPKPLGTVGGLKEIENILNDDFLLLYGDVMINMDLQRLINFHKNKNSELTLVVHPNDHPYDSDLLDINSNERITHFFPKPHSNNNYLRNLVNAGAYIISPTIFKYLKKGKKADFGKDIFPAIYDKVRMFAYNTTEYLKDMGTPERLKEVTRALNNYQIKNASYELKQKAIFLDRDGVLNKNISLIHKPEDLILYDFTAKAIKKINKSVYKAILVTNQPVIARNLCTVEELEYIHKKLETELGKKNAKLDAIYYCPHHPDKGYPEENKKYKIECYCRKPKPGMLIDASNIFNIDLKKSFMIGDSERDIIAGKNAGCRTIGLKSGNAMKNSIVKPDYIFNNLLEAVEFILSLQLN